MVTNMMKNQSNETTVSTLISKYIVYIKNYYSKRDEKFRIAEVACNYIIKYRTRKSRARAVTSLTTNTLFACTRVRSNFIFDKEMFA